MGCAYPVPRARIAPDEPASEREQAARRRWQAPRCSPAWRWAFPGLGHLCLGRTAEGATIAAAGAAEVAVTVAAASRLGLEHPAAAVPLLAASDLYLFAVVHPSLDRQLAAGEVYVPQDTATELALAPFNPRVLARRDVWPALLLTAAVAGAALAAGGTFGDARFPRDPNLFGRRVQAEAGYPAGTAVHAALFHQVALAEETVFRGYLQSTIARRQDETTGWVGGTAIFAAAHLPNALAIDPEDRRGFLLVGMPVITAVGGYLGGVYRFGGYSLAPPVALHFWYDLIVSTAGFLADPDDHLLSAGIAVPF